MGETTKFNYITDSAHGWLEVPVQLLQTYGIEYKITECSYRNGDTAYLEEDVYMPLLLRVLEANGVEVEIIEQYQEKAPIRNYKRFPAIKTEHDMYDYSIREVEFSTIVDASNNWKSTSPQRGFFHGWGEFSETDSGDIARWTVAIVESASDGKVYRVPPEGMRFTTPPPDPFGDFHPAANAHSSSGHKDGDN